MNPRLTHRSERHLARRRAHRFARRLAPVAIAALVLAACGGDDDDEPAAAATTLPPPTETIPAPNATIGADVPIEFSGTVGPIEVTGTPLPVFQGGPGTPDSAVGAPAPVVVGVDFNGIAVRVDAATDGPTMVVFFAHWCPHCHAEIPRLNELRDAGRFPEGLNIVGVSTAVNPDQPNFPPREWLQERDWTYPIIADGIDMEQQSFIAASAFGVGSFPFAALIDGDGMLVERWSGERDLDGIVAAVTALVEG